MMNVSGRLCFVWRVSMMWWIGEALLANRRRPVFPLAAFESMDQSAPATTLTHSHTQPIVF